MPTSSLPEVFISYSYKDEELFKQFEKYLSVLAQNGKITLWHGRKILAGDRWEEVIDEHLKSAHLVLLLVSVDFLASDYCYGVEFRRAMERHAKKVARVVPIILRPCPWRATVIGMLQVLPRNAEPIESWKDRDEAFLSVTDGIREVVERISADNDALIDPAFRRQLTGDADLKFSDYIRDDHLRDPEVLTEPAAPRRSLIGFLKSAIRAVPGVKYVLLLAAIVVAVIVKSFFTSWPQPQEVNTHSPTPIPSATSSPTPTVMPSPTPTIPTGVQITITEVPVYDPVGGRNKKEKIAGKVSGLKSNDYSVVIYALTIGGVWHVQPTTDKPKTEIKPDGTWEAEIQLGSRYVALVVPSNFIPLDKMTSLPTESRGIVAKAEVKGSSQTTGEAK